MFTVAMPRLDPGMQSGKIIEWLKKEGDRVEKDVPIVRIEGEKTTFEANSPGPGIVRKLLFEPGTDVLVGQTIAFIGEPSEPLPIEAEAHATSEPVGIQKAVLFSPAVSRAQEQSASPVARKMAREAGIDISKVKGSGPGGRIVREDVQMAIEQTKTQMATVSVSPQEARPVRVAKMIKLAGKRKATAERLSYAFHTTVPVTITMEARMEAVLELRRQLQSRTGEDVSMTAYVVKAAAKALEDHEMINSSLEGDELRVYADINVAVAINTPDGLMAPIIPQTNRKSVSEISRDIRDLTERAMQDKLTVLDLTGGTFTVTNLGGYGVDLFAPVINPPQCAILGFGRTFERPVVIERQLRTALVTTLSLVFDHRITDGVPAAQYLQQVKELLEDPQKLD
ncbi:MAG TPA: dihydrolipoamide acetyltransferase family protein [Candidatus Acidoferrum sp.]|nr:dihydrolipoamide acetyltransferase family protein [Candidatus Acidoferrum sp.]